MILLPSPIEEILRSWIEIAPFELPIGHVESPFVRFLALARISVCSQGASGRESPDRPAAGEPRAAFSAADLTLWYNTPLHS